VAGASYLFPNDPATQLPVTTGVARLPSVLAGIGTMLILWRLGGAMFGRRAGMVTAVLAASSVCFMLYAPNATVEMLLAFSCTWACFHFWFAATIAEPRRRLLHVYMFYIALGVGMLSKAPAPLALLALPLAVWWFTEEPLSILLESGLAGTGRALSTFFAGLKSRTIEAFKRFHLIPGLILFALVFVPWMLAVAARHPHAWELWNWQYFQRAIGDYPDTRPRGLFYYVPIAIGLIGPWTFALPEALAATGLKRYALQRRALVFCAVWALVGIAVMSAETFKKPYYIVPAVPALILMVAAVLERFYARKVQSPQLGWALWIVAAAGLVVGLYFGVEYLHKEDMPAGAITRVTYIAGGAIATLLLGGIFYIRGRGWWALGLTAAASIATFQLVWFTCAPALANLDKVTELDRTLDAAHVPADAKILWADQRPDARLGFYFARQSRYLITPAEIVAVMVDRTQGKMQLQMMIMDRAAELLEGAAPTYILLERENYELAQSHFSAKARLLGEVHVPNERPGKDWMIVSNMAPPEPGR
jgi:4-amino-4-deoxy-L-arabinose transferase-like glycosyltransferase